jgi:hypothetical protein
MEPFGKQFQPFLGNGINGLDGKLLHDSVLFDI